MPSRVTKFVEHCFRHGFFLRLHWCPCLVVNLAFQASVELRIVLPNTTLIHYVRHADKLCGVGISSLGECKLSMKSESNSSRSGDNTSQQTSSGPISTRYFAACAFFILISSLFSFCCSVGVDKQQYILERCYWERVCGREQKICRRAISSIPVPQNLQFW